MTGPDVRSARDAAIGELRRARPRDRFARASLAGLVLLGATPWISGRFGLQQLSTDRAARNLERFLREIRPYPLQDRAWDFGVWVEWMRARLGPDAAAAVGSTVALSVAAIVLAALGALLAAPFAARTLLTPEPYLPGPRAPSAASRWGHRLLAGGVRAVLVLLRAIPEYVWAYVLLPLVGVGAWPAVLALAVHNAGILGRLGAETLENAEPGPARLLRGIGGGRGTILAAALGPSSLGRFLLYFFYRWETCVREATVLGLLGFVSLGWFVQQARAAARYDEMIHFVALGAGIIVAGDLLSGVARRVLRRAG